MSLSHIKRLFLPFPKERRSDKTLLLLVLLLTCFGTAMIGSAGWAYAESRYGDSGYFLRKQLIFAAVGVLLMLFTSRLPARLFRRGALPLYITTVALLLLTLAFGLTGNGAQRWIGIGPFTFQPSELAKLSLCLILAKHFAEVEEQGILLLSNQRKRVFLKTVLIPLLFTGSFALLVVLQRHLSGLIILCSIGLSLMFLAGSSVKFLASLAGLGVAGVATLAFTLDYARERITVWLNPAAYPLEGGWQTLQGLMAIGSGGAFGLGFGESRMKYSWVSEPANDFIFTITCEELGFFGAFLILSIFFLFILRGFRMGKRIEDSFTRLLSLGIVSKMAIQVLLNISVITNTIPNTGISLPFFSYGGSSLLMLFLEMGILLSCSRHSSLT